MNVKELKELLNEYPDETEVVLSSDAEGNNFSPLDGYSNGKYVSETTWRGEFYSADESDELSDGNPRWHYIPLIETKQRRTSY